uniref:Uncharacterized protein n=2 Tax=Caenorhabditis japonica TaxID=281687 RepID=A0A8R1HVP4_CAEJA
MNEMTVNQSDQPDDRYKDDAAPAVSSSSKDDDSSESEYQPESSSAHQSGNSRRHGRLRKEEKRNMSQKQLEDRRKEANKRNSKKYNKKKKEKEEKLMREFAVQRDHASRTTKLNKEMDSLLMESYSYIGRAIESPEYGFMDKESYEQRKSEIESEARQKKINDRNLQKLATNLQTIESAHKKAEEDRETKTKNQNTYGSRKSRALHSMNIAKYEYEKVSIQHNIERLAKLENLMNEVKYKFSQFFNIKNLTPGWMDLEQNDKDRLDELVKIYKISAGPSTLRTENIQTQTILSYYSQYGTLQIRTLRTVEDAARPRWRRESGQRFALFPPNLTPNAYEINCAIGANLQRNIFITIHRVIDITFYCMYSNSLLFIRF